jgi:O-antigen/teichoic acid export membrane protein
LSFVTLFAAVFSSFQRVDYDIGIREVGEKLFRGLLTLLLVYLGFGVIGASVSYIFSTFLMLAICIFLMQKKIFPIFKTNHKVKYHSKELFLFSLPLLFTVLLNSSTYSISTFFLGYFKALSEVGIFNAALPTASLVTMVPFAVTSLFIPIVTKLFTRKKTGLIGKIYKTINRWIFFVNLPIFLIMLFFPRQILRILFGQNYVAGAVALSILSFGFLSYSLTYANAPMLHILKKTKIIFLNASIFAITSISLNLLLVPIYGFVGAAIATTFSYLTLSFLSSFFAYKYTRLQPFSRRYIKPMLSAIISILVVYFVARLFTGLTAQIYGLILVFLFFLLFYLGLLFLFRSFEKEDKELLKLIFGKLNRKLLFKK